MDVQPAAKNIRYKEWLGILWLFSSGCQITEIEIERTGEALIPSAGVTDEFVMDHLNGMDFILEEFPDLGVEERDLSRAELTSLDISILAPFGVDFSFADTIEVFADSPELGRVRIAHQDEFPVGATSIAFEADGTDIQSYLASDEFSIVAVFTGGSPQRDLSVEGTATLTVGVTLGGACRQMR